MKQGELRVQQLGSDRLAECFVTAKAEDPGTDRLAYVVTIEGRVVSRHDRLIRVVVLDHGNRIGAIKLDSTTPGDDQPEDAFRISLSATALAQRFDLSVVAVLADESRVGIARIVGERPRLKSNFEPRIQPLLVTTTGRSGSTALVNVLGAHPEIVSLESDAKIAPYWIETLRQLADPTKYLAWLFPRPLRRQGEIGWWIGTGEGALPRTSFDTEGPDAPFRLHAMGGTEALVTFVQERIDAVYRGAAEKAGLPGATYCVEKGLTTSAPYVMEIYPKGREVILVRDFRDFACSVLAYNAKTEIGGWMADLHRDHEEQIRWLGKEVNRLVRGWQTRSGRAHLVRYEDLVLQPAAAVEGLLRYLDLTRTDDVVDAMTAPLSERAEGHRTTRSAAESIGRWRRDLTPELQAVAQKAFGPALEVFGYS